MLPPVTSTLLPMVTAVKSKFKQEEKLTSPKTVILSLLPNQQESRGAGEQGEGEILFSKQETILTLRLPEYIPVQTMATQVQSKSTPIIP